MDLFSRDNMGLKFSVAGGKPYYLPRFDHRVVGGADNDWAGSPVGPTP
jgi:hypothetical protein